MRRFTEQYKTHPTIRELALRLTRNLPQKDYASEQRVLWDYVKNNIRYVRDIHEVETVQTPLKTLEYGAGDCDDKSSLLACLLESLGHPTRFYAMGFRAGNLCHVMVESLLNGRWVPLETTEPVSIGWTPPGVQERMYNYGPNVNGLGSMDGFFSKLIKHLNPVQAVKDLKQNVSHAAKDIKQIAVHSIEMSKPSNILNPKKEIAVIKKDFQKDILIAGPVATVISYIPGPWQPIAKVISLAADAQILYNRAQAAKQNAKDANDLRDATQLAASAAAQLTQLKSQPYLLDQTTGQIRAASATEVSAGTAPLYTFDFNANKLIDSKTGKVVDISTFLPTPSVPSPIVPLNSVVPTNNPVLNNNNSIAPLTTAASPVKNSNNNMVMLVGAGILGLLLLARKR